MIVLDMDQGTEEWDDARLSVPTASVFDQIITSTGAKSKQYQKLIYKFAGERIIGHKEVTYSNAAMERGIALEGEARSFFELITELDVHKVGMCYTDEQKDSGCSPDGFVGESVQSAKEGLEIKCPSLAVHVEYLIKNKLPTKYLVQVQGSMFVTGFETWHFFSYYPNMKPLHVIVERDEIWIAKFSKLLADFNEELNEVYNDLKMR